MKLPMLLAKTGVSFGALAAAFHLELAAGQAGGAAVTGAPPLSRATAADASRWDLSALVPEPPTPLFRAPPVYPPRALASGVTGAVELEFTIKTDGTVEDIVIVRSDSRGVFDEVAAAALARWRYAPQPAAVEGVRTELTFQIEGRPLPTPTGPVEQTQQMFSKAAELCGARRQSADVRRLCGNLDSIVSALRSPIVERRRATFGEAAWTSFVRLMALDVSGKNRDSRSDWVRTQLGVDEARAHALMDFAAEAVRAESERWLVLEREIICGQRSELTNGAALGRAVKEVDAARKVQRDRLLAQMLTLVDPATADELLRRAGRASATTRGMDFEGHLSRWSTRDVEAALTVVCD